jgi:hypothetical protein
MRIGCYLILLAKGYHRIRTALNYHMIQTINCTIENGIEESVGSFAIAVDNQVLDLHTILSVIKLTTYWPSILVLQGPICSHV